MQVIKTNQLIDNAWTYVPEIEAIPHAGNITVSLVRWQQDKALLLNQSGKHGIRISPADTLEGVVADLNHIDLIELNFPELADGRLFSLAWLLRSRYSYQGEIRAIGHYLPDQVFYLSRVGVDAFAPNKPEDIPAILAGLADFSVAYQESIN